MKIQAINTEKDYQEALSRLEIIFDAEVGTAEGNEARLLSLLIEKYEYEHFPLD